MSAPNSVAEVVRTLLASMGACLFALAFVHSSAQAEDADTLLEEYIQEDGYLSNSDYEWFAWKFSSDETLKSKWAELFTNAVQSTERNKAEMQERVRDLGYDATKVKGGCGADDVCEAVLMTGLLGPIDEWANAKAAIDEAVPYFSAYLNAIEAIESSLGENQSRGLAAELLERKAFEQALRSALTNAERMPDGISSNGGKAWRMLIWRETVKRDLANTAWLKSVVASQGWPTKSKVGADAAHAAWLLVQHADRDPAFQVEALLLMERSIPQGEVDSKDYAFLHDRVIGELKGAQRYGTQMVCRDGRFVPQDLEDPEGLAQRRKEMGLPPLIEQLGRFASRSC